MRFGMWWESMIMKGEVKFSVIDIQPTRVIGGRELSSQIIRGRNIQASESDITEKGT
jgi:hypothetical protein